jgi:hypothetical protein
MKTEKKISLPLGLLLVVSLFSSLMSGSSSVICVSDSHVALEKRHNQELCVPDLPPACESGCAHSEPKNEKKEKKQHNHCPEKSDCGDCVDFQMPGDLNDEELSAIQVSDLCFLAGVLPAQQEFVMRKDFREYSINRDIDLNTLSPPQAFKLSTILLV